MNNVSFRRDHELRRQPMLEYTRITFGSPEIRRLQRELAFHRWLLCALSVTFALHSFWGP